LPTLVFYISGHGFGHASRDIEVINAILSLRDDVRVIARTTAPHWLFERTVAGRNFTWSEVETDTGVVQIDSLHLDETATIARARAFIETFAMRVAREADFLREQHASVAVADIPALGIAAAKAAGIPAVAVGNFTWDWIYAAYDGARDIVDHVGEVYAAADMALRLPLHGGFATFRTIVDVPFIARRSRREPADTRRLMGFPSNTGLALLSFGGYGIQHIHQNALTGLQGYRVIGSAAHPLDEAAMYDAGLRYEDIVRAVDVVVTKPGYGIVSECIANETALLYTSRGHFAEYDVFVREMPRYLRAQFIPHEDLFAGRWQAPLDALAARAAPPERPPVDGADVVARRLLDMI
jgi:hypothetical protein